MDRSRRLRHLGLSGMALAVALAACTTPPGGAPRPAPAPSAAPAEATPSPAAEPAPAPEAPPAGPMSAQQAQRLALSAVEMLELGHEDQALAEIQRALQADPNNRLAQSLLRQVQTDPQTLLGREHFSYRVQPGESLSRIAGRFLNDIHLFYALARYNDIRVPRQLQGGQMIKVPGKAPPPGAATAAPAPSPVPPAAPAPAPTPVPAPVPAPAPVAPPPAARAPAAPSAETLIAQDYRRGLSLMAQQKPAEAIDAFDQVLERDPNHANAKLKRAQALSQVSGLIRLLDNTIRRLDGQIAQNPNDAQLKAQRDKAVADRERLLKVK